MIITLTFEHYFIETVNLMEPWMYKYINPYTHTFIKVNNTYMALQIIGDKVIIGSTVGKGLFISELKHEFKRLNINKVVFGTKKSNKTMNQIAKYCKAKITYDDEEFIHYEIDLNNNERFKK